MLELTNKLTNDGNTEQTHIVEGVEKVNSLQFLSGRNRPIHLPHL